MACSFAPHNITEVMDAIIYLHNNPNADKKIVLSYIKGPDFPTGGTIINKDELIDAYLTGKGRVRIRGNYIIEHKTNKDILVFTSIPYKVSKENLTVEIDQLCTENKIDGITEIRDETNKNGVRFVIELAKGISGEVIANKLYSLTDLETTYSINQVALINKTPKLMPMYNLLQEYLNHQYDVYRRKTQFDLDKLEKRIHILDGLSRAVEDIDNVISLIKHSENAADAKISLMKKYDFSDAQAKAILDMKLSRLAHIEKIEIDNERQEKKEQAIKLKLILTSDEAFTTAVSKELTEFRNKFVDERRTEITQINISKEDREIAEIIPEDCVVIINESSNINILRVPSSQFKVQKRNGKGVKLSAAVTKHTIKTNTLDSLMIFTTFGRVYKLNVNDIPIGTNLSIGTALQALIPIAPKENFSSAASMSHSYNEKDFVWFVTQQGLIKKTSINEYTSLKRKTGVSAINLHDNDTIISTFIEKDTSIMLFTKDGYSIRFDGETIGTTSRTSVGVKGIALKDNDLVIKAIPLTDYGSQICLFSKNGLSKRINTHDFSSQMRGGKGLICTKELPLCDAIEVNENDTITVFGRNNSICIAAKDISLSNRSGVGVKVINDTEIITVNKL